jgi:hypothetical protein
MCPRSGAEGLFWSAFDICVTKIWINRIEPRVMVKYFFLKRYESKLIHKKLVSTFQENAISLSIVKNWLKRSKSGDLSCGDEKRPGIPLISLGSALQRFLKKFPFASSRVIAAHFSLDRVTIKNILDREPGLRKFTCRCVPYIRCAEQRLRKVTESQSLLTILVNLAAENFQGIITGYKSWFGDFIESDAMFASSPAEATLTARPSISCKKVMIPLFTRKTADRFWMPYRKDPNTIRIILLIIYFRLSTKSGPETPAVMWCRLGGCIWTIQGVRTE